MNVLYFESQLKQKKNKQKHRDKHVILDFKYMCLIVRLQNAWLAIIWIRWTQLLLLFLLFFVGWLVLS